MSHCDDLTGDMDRNDAFDAGADSPVASWAAELRGSLIEPIDQSLADHQAGLAAEAARLTDQPDTSAGTGQRSPIRRRGIVFSGILSSMLAKAMAAAVALAAVGGGAAAAGVDLNPFSGDDPVVAAFDFDDGTTTTTTTEPEEGEGGETTTTTEPEEGEGGETTTTTEPEEGEGGETTTTTEPELQR